MTPSPATLRLGDNHSVVCAGGGKICAIKMERAPGGSAFPESEQDLTLAFAACLNLPPSASNPIVTRRASSDVTAHDPESRRLRYGLRFLHAKIVGESSCLIAALRRLEQALLSPKHVLILGETGSGKEQMARALVEDGISKGWRFVKVDLAGLSATLIESELFGHVKGAFTGAIRDKVGIVGGGGKLVLFFDEIGNLPLEIQVKLLHFIETGEYRRVGDEKVSTAKARIVAATSADLEALMAEGKFKTDLLFRLAQKIVRVPALRNRCDDFPRLLASFFGEDARRFGQEAIAAIAAHAWPGNVREFHDVLEDLLERNPGIVEAREFRAEIAFRPSVPGPRVCAADASLANVKNLRGTNQRAVLAAALERFGYDISAIAKASGYSLFGLKRVLLKIGLGTNSPADPSAALL